MEKRILKTSNIIAISVQDFQKFGCPYCGYRSGSSSISYMGTSDFQCGECAKTTFILATGTEVSALSSGSGNTSVHPKLETHPRKGTPSHGNPDTRPEKGGEFFRSRGIGKEIRVGCFVCNTSSLEVRNNISGFVNTKEAGERILDMFKKKGAWLDYREHEPDRVQVKIVVCNKHKKNLQKLDELVTKDGIITIEKVVKAQTHE